MKHQGEDALGCTADQTERQGQRPFRDTPDFISTVVIMTSNAATDTIMKLCADPETMPGPEALAEALHSELLKSFKPAFLGRILVVPFFPLGDDIMRQIAVLKLGKVARRVKEHYDAEFTWSEAVLDHVASRWTGY